VQGVLESGQEIAVKRLSLESRQGAREFLNEVRLLLKVQHRNLVSLLGCCASSSAGAGAGHKMLVYPYFPNGSLDHFLFGASLLSCHCFFFNCPFLSLLPPSSIRCSLHNIR
jgi:serine/threonine protein kinase